MADLGMQIAQQYLSPFDQLVGIIGKAGSGKSMLIKGMFPGLELTNDDGGVNVRPLPLLSVTDEATGFYSPHTYHVDIHFDAAFTPMFILAEAIEDAIKLGKRVIVEHFELVRPFLKRNAHLLIGIGEEVVITRPTAFGPHPDDIAKIVQRSLNYRFMAHSAEEIATHYVEEHTDEVYTHDDVRHGFILSFQKKPNLDLQALENYVNEMINQNLPISFKDDDHILIGEMLIPCSGPRMHVKRTGDIKQFDVAKDFVQDPITGRYQLIGMVGEHDRFEDLNRIAVT
jgi:hypothetical protein